MAPGLRTTHLEAAGGTTGLIGGPASVVDMAALEAVPTLVSAAVRRSGPAAVGRSLTRTERVPDDLVRVL